MGASTGAATVTTESASPHGGAATGATMSSTAKNGVAVNGTAKNGVAAPGAPTNKARSAGAAAPLGVARLQTTAATATGRPIVSSIRERTGTQRPAARKRYEVKRSWWQERKAALLAIIGGILIVAILVLVARGQGTGTVTNPVPANVMSSLTSISPNTFAAVGSGGVKNPFIGVTGGSGLTNNGKPEILYIGGEYCPYCAAERWSLVIALSRFGTFSGLQTTSSSASDAFPSTNTFTFVKATYTSNYLSFVPVEVYDQNGNPLQTLTHAQQALFNQYDAPPYVSSQDKGGIPFVDYGNQFITVSSGFSPALLHAGGDPNGTPLTDRQIAQALSNPNSPVAQAIIGNANYITAGICKLTNNQPGSVCNTSVIQQLEAQLPKNS